MWGQPLLRGKTKTLYHGENKIPDTKDFEPIYKNYCEKMLHIGTTLVKAFEKAFELENLRLNLVLYLTGALRKENV